MSGYLDVWMIVPPAAAEWAGAALCRAGSSGVVESPLPDQGVKVLGSILAERRTEAEESLKLSFREALDAGILEAEPELGWAETPPFDWLSVLKHHHRPFEVGGIRVRPPWDEPTGGPEIVMEPGMGFGTGSHETTRLCMEALTEELSPDDTRALLDVGTGSGILALVSLRKCPGLRAVGCDIDLDAIQSASQAASLNQLQDRFELHLGRLDPAWGRFPVVVANLQWNVFIEELERIVPLVEPGGVLFCSGLLLSQATPMTQLAEGLGLEFRSRTDKGEWTLLRFHRP